MKQVYRIIGQEKEWGGKNVAIAVREDCVYDTLALCSEKLREYVGPIRVGKRFVIEATPDGPICAHGAGTSFIVRRNGFVLSLSESQMRFIMKHIGVERPFNIRRAKRGETEID